MDTNITLSHNGEYPISDNCWPSFDQMWKDELSTLPEAPQKWKDRESYRIFAQKVYERLIHSHIVKDVTTTAYEDGCEDGFNNCENKIIKEIRQMRLDYPASSIFLDQIIEKIKSK